MIENQSSCKMAVRSFDCSATVSLIFHSLKTHLHSSTKQFTLTKFSDEIFKTSGFKATRDKSLR